MITAKYNLNIQAGETVNRQFRIITATGIPFDLTDYTMSSYIKNDYTSATASAIFDVTSPSATEGLLNLNLSFVSSSLLTGSCYYYDIRLQKDDEVLYPLEGKVVVSPSITR